MFVNWEEIKKALVPVKDYEDLIRRFRVSFSYPFVREIFNHSMPELVEYTKLLLGGDARGRYTNYASLLVRIFAELHQSGVRNTGDLYSRVQTRQQLEDFASQAKIHAHDIVSVLKYLVYWYIPGEKYLSGLVRDDPDASNAIKMLSKIGIRTNLDLLQQGRTAASRTALAASSALPESVVFDLVNRADLSRLPWASKATISNILGAGCASLAELANAEPGQLFEDFFRYGRSIGKNLKFGNEIENSYRIARIVPSIVQNDNL